MDFNNKELLEKIEHRFDRLESRLEEFTKSSVQNQVDMNWVKGYIKVSITMLISIITALVAGFIKVFTGEH